MKSFIILATVAYVCAFVSGELSAELKKEIHDVEAHCKEEVPDVDEAHVEKLKRDQEVVDDAALKKFLFCFNKKMHVQNDDGAFDVDALKEGVASWIGSHDHDHDIEECTKDLHHDGPENAYEFSKCIEHKLPKVDYV